MMQVHEQVAEWKSAAAAVLDVRPTLERGDEPFIEIIETAARIPLGESLVIIAPFEPAPLYAALGERGFSHATQPVSTSEWVVRFTRER
jgi:uncharacterized protein (DUF2249 family)